MADWTLDFIYDMAIGIFTEEEVCERHNVAWSDFERWQTDKGFVQAYAEMKQKLLSSGESTRLRAKAILDANLVTLHRTLNDPEVTGSAKAQIFAKLADYAKVNEVKDEERQPDFGIVIAGGIPGLQAEQDG